MKKVRYYYWIFQSIFQRHFLLILLAAFIGAVTFTQSNRLFQILPKPKPSLHIGRTGLFTLSNLPIDIQNLVSDGLTQIDPSGKPIPKLAKDWKIIDSGNTYVFSLPDNLFWQDGTPFTSQDVNYSFQDVTVETPDDHTVVFKLSEAFTPFPGILSQPLFKRTSIQYFHTITSNKIIGTGTYTISQLTRNGAYIQELHLESNKDKLVYHFYTTESALITAFKLGEIDKIEDLSNLYDLSGWPHLQITPTLNKQRFSVIFFNTNDSEKNLSNKSIRQALAYVTPKPTDEDLRALSPISPYSWAYNPKVKPYAYSLETAKDLLKDLNTDFEITLSTTPSFVELADQIKSSWEKLGIQVKVKVTNIPDTTNFQALLIGQQIPKDPDQYQFWHSTQETNITGYQSAKIDKLLEDGRKELDFQKRKLIYQDFQRFLIEDSPAVFLQYLTSYTVQR